MKYSPLGTIRTAIASFGVLALAAGVVHGADGSVSGAQSYYKKEGSRWLLVEKGDDGRVVRIDRNVKPPDVAGPSIPATIYAMASAPSEAAGATAMNYYPSYQAYPVGSWPEAVAIEDLNLDGRKDVVITTSTYSDPENDRHIFVFYQSESGTLDPPVKFRAAGSPVTIDVADLNGDGWPDIVVGSKGSPDHIEIFIQYQPGTFISAYTFATSQSYCVRAADLNDDGMVDVAGIGWSTKRAEVYLQRSTGGFVLDSAYFANYAGYNDFATGNLNGDHRTDMVISSGQGLAEDAFVLLQNDSRHFNPAMPCVIPGNFLPGGITIGDVTGDSRADVIVSYGGNRPNSKIGIFVQRASGTFDSFVSYNSYDIPEDIAAGDVNRDGLTDVFVVHGGWNRVGVYEQNADGTLAPEQLFSIPYASHYNPNGLAVGDINGDGSDDIVIADYNYGLVVLRNAYSRLHASFTALPKSGVSPLTVDFDASTSYDPEGDPLTYHWYFGDGGSATDRVVSHTYAVKGNYTVIMAVYDGSGNADTAGEIITVHNSAPILEFPGDASVPENGILLLTLHATDADGDALVFSAGGLPPGATFDPATATFAWQPGFDQAGVYPGVRFSVSDGELGDEEVVAVTVINTNRPPVAVDDAGAIGEDSPVTINVIGNDADPDGDALIIETVTTPVNGSVVVNVDNTITYVPAVNFYGADQFTYTITDGGGGSASATVSVTVTPINDPPSAAITSPADGATIKKYRNVNIYAVASDIDGVVVKVQFYRDGLYLGQDTTAPFTGVWLRAIPGTHLLSCKAFDGSGAVTQSANVTIIVQ